MLIFKQLLALTLISHTLSSYSSNLLSFYNSCDAFLLIHTVPHVYNLPVKVCINAQCVAIHIFWVDF